MECINHPNRNAIDICSFCKKPICTECNSNLADQVICVPCVDKWLEKDFPDKLKTTERASAQRFKQRLKEAIKDADDKDTKNSFLQLGVPTILYSVIAIALLISVLLFLIFYLNQLLYTFHKPRRRICSLRKNSL